MAFALTWIIGALAFAIVGCLLWPRSAKSTPKDSEPVGLDPREESLALRLARVAGCTVAQALPAVRREIDYAPHQSDDTLFKRALYHYRQDQPERGCPTYLDSSPG